MHLLTQLLGVFVGLTLLFFTAASGLAAPNQPSIRATNAPAGAPISLPQQEGDEETWVGVIPSAQGCGPEAELVEITMINEVKNNQSRSTGWVGSIINGSATHWRFCKVRGELFGPLPGNQIEPGITPESSYAVLMLSDHCPAASYPLHRYFDNEDNDSSDFKSVRSNRATGPIYPNVTRTRKGTDLFFCFFPNNPFYEDPYAMAGFPDLGIEYGVFAAADFPWGLKFGSLHIDDEDHDNHNGFTPEVALPPDAAEALGHIFTFADNSDLNLAQVRLPSKPFDLRISLYQQPDAAERISYTQAISYFADAVFEMSNGAHQIGRVCIYEGGKRQDSAQVVWQDVGRANASPGSYDPSRGYIAGRQINMYDRFTVTESLISPPGRWLHTSA